MSKKILIFSIFLISLVFTLVGCKENTSTESKKAVSPYEEFDKVAEEFFIAYQIKDYDTMKKYLSKSDINQSAELKEAEKGEVLHPEYKEMMKGRYTIKGLDYYYNSHNQVIYLVDFYDPSTGNQHRYGMYGVEKNNDQYNIMNITDSRVLGLHFENETGQPKLDISSLKDLMEKYPENVYEVSNR